MASPTSALRGLHGPRRERHVMPVDHLGALTLPLGDDGVMVGYDAENRPAVLGLHHPDPFDVLLIGGLWTAQAIALRAAGTGARVAVETGRPQLWTNLVRAAGAGQECMTLHDVGRVPPMGATVGSPVLVVRDAGMRPPRGRVSAAPWQSVLTLLPYVSPVAPRLMNAAGLVGVQRISPQEAAEVGRVLGLPQTDVTALSSIGDGITMWCGDGAGGERARQYVMTHPTDAEAGLLGSPRRVD